MKCPQFGKLFVNLHPNNKWLWVQYSDAKANIRSRYYSNEEERIHIHVLCGGHEAKFWLEPQVELARNTGIPEHKLNEIKKIVEKYADNFKEQFRQHIGKRIDD